MADVELATGRPPPGFARVVYLVAKLVFTRGANRLRAGLRRRPRTPDARRTGTARKAPLGRAGLAPQRQLLRMCRGEGVNDDVARLWASSGPELG